MKDIKWLNSTEQPTKKQTSTKERTKKAHMEMKRWIENVAYDDNTL